MDEKKDTGSPVGETGEFDPEFAHAIFAHVAENSGTNSIGHRVDCQCEICVYMRTELYSEELP